MMAYTAITLPYTPFIFVCLPLHACLPACALSVCLLRLLWWCTVKEIDETKLHSTYNSKPITNHSWQCVFWPIFKKNKANKYQSTPNSMLILMMNSIHFDTDDTSLAQICREMFCQLFFFFLLFKQMIPFSCSLLEGVCCSTFSFIFFQRCSAGIKSGVMQYLARSYFHFLLSVTTCRFCSMLGITVIVKHSSYFFQILDFPFLNVIPWHH